MVEAGLQHRILSGAARAAVVGLGYVGLPLAVLCCRQGFRTLGVDKDESRLDSIRRCRPFTPAVSADDLAVIQAGGNLALASSYAGLSTCDVIVLCVPTPLTAGKPDHSHLLEAAQALAPILAETPPGQRQLVIVESTVAPGAIEGDFQRRLEEGGAVAGRTFHLAFSPERLDVGNPSFRLENTPKLVAGTTPDCQRTAQWFYNRLGIPTVPVSSIQVAELSKLLENVFRDVNIALVNELARLCRLRGVDVWEVVGAAATKPFGFESFRPGPGVGGHCIPVDSVYYASWARELSTRATLAEVARKINAQRPGDVVTGLEALLAARGRRLAGSRVLVLGATYKEDVPDTRESAAIKLLDRLAEAGADVAFYDPHVASVEVRGRLLQTLDMEAGGRSESNRFDVVLLAVPHTCYRSTRLPVTTPLLVDLTDTANPRLWPGAEVVKL